MAKSKKSKILAMALCASVMTGIYAAPVMAAGQVTGLKDSTGAVLTADDTVSINGVELTIRPDGLNGTVKAAGGTFTQLTVTNGMEITGGGLTVGDTNIDFTTGNTEVGGTLTAIGAASLNGGLKVTGNANLEKLNVNGKLTVDAISGVVADNLTVDTNANVQGDLTVENALTAGATNVSSLAVNTDKFTVDGVTGNTTVGGTLTAGSGNFTVDTDGNTTIIGADKQLTVEGTAQIGTMTATTAQVGGDLTVGGETTLAGLTAKGAADLQDGLTVSKGATVNGGLTVDTDRFVVDGVTGNTTVGGTLNVNGDTTLAGLTANGAANLKGGLTVTGGAKADSLEVTGDTTLNGLTAGETTVESLDVTKGIEAANGKFELTEDGNLTVNGEATFVKSATAQGGLTVHKGLSVTGGASVDGNFAVTNGGLSVTGGKSVLNDGLTVSGDTLLNGNLDVGAGDFKVDTAGNTEINGNLNINHGNFTVDAATGNTVVKGTLNLGSLDGREVGEVINGLEEYTGKLQDANLPDKVGGIERDPESAGDPGNGTTTIENGAEFTETAMTMGDTIVESGKITVGAEADNQTIINGGTLTLNGKDVGKTIGGIERVESTVAGADYTTIIENGALKISDNGYITNEDGTFAISPDGSFEMTELDVYNGQFVVDKTGVHMNLGKDRETGRDFDYKGSNGINLGKVIDDIDTRLDDLEYKTQNINGSEGTSAGTGEGGTAAGIDVPATGEGHTGINGDVTVGGEINAGEIVVGDKDSNNKTTIDDGNITVNGGENGSTTINGGNITTGDINAGNGNFTGNVDVDVEVTVGEGTTITGTGINTGNGNFTGNVDVDGEVTVGDDTIITGEGITTGDITADTGTIGNVDMDNTGITVGDGTIITDGNINLGGENGTNINADGMTVGTGENATSITNDTVKAQNGDFDKLTAGSGTFGTGNNKTVIDNDGVTVGGDNGSSITGEGITVGDKNGVSIKNDEVRVGGGEDGKGGSYMNDTDVVTGEGVSLNQTAERVGHLENRVGKLEDRIDKVGAMSAAIANLRTMGYDPAAPTEIAVGVGQYRSETGAALGLFHYPNRDFMLSLSVSTSGDEVMGGIGATWKFGRKSPEKVAEIKKAQAEADARRAEEAKLAKAEEMKQAAKEAKIKAQQERHAKLAAQAEAAK